MIVLIRLIKINYEQDQFSPLAFRVINQRSRQVFQNF